MTTPKTSENERVTLSQERLLNGKHKVLWSAPDETKRDTNMFENRITISEGWLGSYVAIEHSDGKQLSTVPDVSAHNPELDSWRVKFLTE